ncbi:hypothetical protein AG1IA_05258 [Rhizoctonia solani AG-1 IA]|uniref:Uncharacterized protein n=1 Tax=Thanatephorus cucumeris (strain AG1-IA) TaxID=983506 RepID=L8WRU4_THACA|nr:hypothetical protein AG1IA_05258 [Rhizoctonia solani AG-1 IA]
MPGSGSGHRIPCSATENIPEVVFETQTEFSDVGGHPIYVASALMEDSVHPCKCAPHLELPCRVPYGGAEYFHEGRYDILPITRDMEWVPAFNGGLPYGRTPVEGGYEGDNPLYHAYIETHGVKVPGKTGAHLVGLTFSCSRPVKTNSEDFQGGINVAFGGQELSFADNYYILTYNLAFYAYLLLAHTPVVEHVIALSRLAANPDHGKTCLEQ